MNNPDPKTQISTAAATNTPLNMGSVAFALGAAFGAVHYGRVMAPVGFVIRIDLEQQFRDVIHEIFEQQKHTAWASEGPDTFYGVQVYFERQEEECLAFYSHEALREYLKKKNA